MTLILNASSSALRPSAGRASSERKKRPVVDNCLPGITLQGTAGDDRLIGTADSDKLRGREGNDRLEGRGCRDRLFGQAGNDRLEGGGGRDRLFGGNDDDRLNGGIGNDTLVGGDGQDRLNGGAGRDTLRGNTNIDLLTGGGGADNLDGGGGNDTLRGDSGADQIAGGGGDDLIVGGFGADQLTGGSGNDRFFYNSIAEGVDRIRNFDARNDKIDLSEIFKNSKYNTDNRFRDYLVVVKADRDTIIRIDADGENGDRPFVDICRLVRQDFSNVGRSNFVL